MNRAQASTTTTSSHAADFERIEAKHVNDVVEKASTPSDKRLIHPASGLTILGLDWMFFGGTIATGSLGLFFMSFFGFLLGTAVVFLSQKFLSGDNTAPALGKSIVAGLLVGVPTPIVGTAAGTGVLMVSGLRALMK